MTVQIAVKLPDDLLNELDNLVRAGAFASRSQAVRAGVEAVISGQHRRLLAEKFREGFAKLPDTPQEIADSTRLAVDAIHEEPWERWW